MGTLHGMTSYTQCVEHLDRGNAAPERGRLPEEVACRERHPSGGESGSRGRRRERAVGMGARRDRGRGTATGSAGYDVEEETEADSHGAGARC